MFGEEFTSMLAYCDWKEPITTFPFLRLALACCQLTCPKSSQKDRFSRLITKSDFDKLTGKKAHDDILKAEKLTAAGWELVNKSQASVEHVSLQFGKFQITLSLWLLGKQQKGREGVCYDNMEKISEKFQEDLLQCSSESLAVIATASTEVASSSVKSLDEATDAVAIALSANKHIKVGRLFTIKAKDEDPCKVWELVSLASADAKLCHQPFFAAVVQKEVKLTDLQVLKEWTKPAPAMVAAETKASMLPCGSSMLAQELEKVKVQCALYDKYHELGDPEVQVSNNHQIFAGEKFNKGKLVLLPLGFAQVIPKDKEPKNACTIQGRLWRPTVLPVETDHQQGQSQPKETVLLRLLAVAGAMHEVQAWRHGP